MAYQRSSRRLAGDNEGLLSLPQVSPPSDALIARNALKRYVNTDCLDQSESLLYKTLSAEIRQKIFRIFLEAVFHGPASHLDEDNKCLKDPIYCSIDTALLRTCRMVYLEAEFMPIQNDIHCFFGSQDPRYYALDPSEFDDKPDYGTSKHRYRHSFNSRITYKAFTLVPYERMLARFRNEIRQVRLYDAGGRPDLGIFDCAHLEFRPRRVLLVCPFTGDRSLMEKIRSGLYSELEELQLRLDAHPKDQQKFKKELLPELSLKKPGGRLLLLVEHSQPQLAGPWTGLDHKGNSNKWHSLTHVWRVKNYSTAS